MTEAVTLDPIALDAAETRPTALAVSAGHTGANPMKPILLDPKDFQLSVLNHTALQLAGLKGDARAHVLRQRTQQLIGMLELARRLGDDALVHALESHRDALLHLIATA